MVLARTPSRVGGVSVHFHCPDDNMSVERPLPKLRRSRVVGVVAVFIAVAIICVLWAARIDSLTPFWFVAAGLVTVIVGLYYRRRCPQCGRRMVYRAEPLAAQPNRHRILFDCKHCGVVWDSGEIQDEISAAS
jgi:uncharacterized protein YjeT (DUF2065 family)